MRIVLVKVQDTAAGLTLTAVQYPVNIGYLAAVCLKHGHEVAMWDFCVEPYSKEIVRQRIEAFKPDILGVSCVTPAIYFGNEICTIAKEVNPDIVTLVGGAQITALPQETMDEFPNFDIGVLMEGEDVLPQIIERVEKKSSLAGIGGTVYRDDKGKAKLGGCAPLPDINAIPFVNRELIPHKFYAGKHAIRGITRTIWKLVEIDTARGCPFTCTFCNVEMMHGKGVRFRTPDNVLREVETCVKKFGTNFIVFNDSTFTLQKDRVKEIVTGLPKRGIQGYYVTGHVNAVSVDMLETLSRTGCKKILFGIESGSPKTLKRIRKNSTVEKIREAFRNAKKAKIPIVEGSFILGSDIYETEEDFQLSENLLNEIRPDMIGVGIITPYPGTEQFDEMRKLGYLKNVRWDQFQIFGETPPPWRIPAFTSEELANRRNKILRSYYWNWRYISHRLKRVNSVAELLYWGKMAKSFFEVVVRNRKPAAAGATATAETCV